MLEKEKPVDPVLLSKKKVSPKKNDDKEAAKKPAKESGERKTPRKKAEKIGAESKKIKSPDKLIVQTLSPDVVILPQSQNKVFLIWRADSSYDAQTDSWLIITDFGEKARVPGSARSVFLSGENNISVKIYRVDISGSEELFLTKKFEVEQYSCPPSYGQGESEHPRLNSSSGHFQRRISS